MISELFKEVVQQDKAKAVLTRIYQSRRVPHAFLFYGKEGVGKFNTAIQFAKLLNAVEGYTGVDERISSLQEPYVKLIMSLPRGKGEGGDDTAFDKLSKDVVENITNQIKQKSLNPYYKIRIDDANTIKISSIREIRKFVSVQVESVKYRIVVILDAHLMNDQAQNALLKNLEEPPEGIVFILITPNKERLLHTIQSRCWTVNFDPLDEEDVGIILKQYYGIEDSVARKAAHFADGSVTEALSLAQSNLDSVLEKTISVLRYSLAKRYSSAHKELNEFLKESSDESVSTLIRMIKTWIRDAAKNKSQQTDFYFNSYSETLDKFNTRFNQTNLIKLFSIFDKLDELTDKKVNLNVLSLSLIFEISSVSIG